MVKLQGELRQSDVIADLSIRKPHTFSDGMGQQQNFQDHELV